MKKVIEKIRIYIDGLGLIAVIVITTAMVFFIDLRDKIIRKKNNGN